MKKIFLLVCMAASLTIEAATQVTVAQFISYADTETAYRLRGWITREYNATYGSYYVADASGEILMYNPSNRASFTFGVGDTITIEGVYAKWGSTHEIKAPTIIEVKHPTEEEDDDTIDCSGIDYNQTYVDFETAFACGWDNWIGKTLTFMNGFYLCDRDNNIVAPSRLRAPEEYGEEGTKAYENAVTRNANMQCQLTGLSFESGCRLGAMIQSGLQAKVVAANQLQALNTPPVNYWLFLSPPQRKGGDTLLVCAANLQNFFVTLGGYAGAENETQLERQKTKISKALYAIDADIYALCELEQGPRAATELVSLLNALAGKEQYDWIDEGFTYYDGLMICYIYRTDKVQPYGNYIMPYTSAAMKYREAIQCFEQNSTGERFNLALNHFYAKTSKEDSYRVENMNSLINKFYSATNNDEDILVVGDLNAYTMEESNLKLTRDKGYTDLLMKYAPQGYSYVYNGLVGYLDHAYCNPSMESQVLSAEPCHFNADAYYRMGYKYDTSMSFERYADHDPILITLQLGKKSPTEAIEIQTDKVPATKIIENGRVVIIRGGMRYTVTGIRLQ